MEHAHPIDRNFPWRRVAPALAFVVAIALVVTVGRALIHHIGASAAVPRKHTPASPATHPGKLRPRSRMSVLVLNGSGINGAAGGIANRLLTHGYRSAPATNAQVTTYARSVILYRPGWAGEATRLAKDSRIRTVAPLDGSLPAGYARYPLVAIVGQ